MVEACSASATRESIRLVSKQNQPSYGRADCGGYATRKDSGNGKEKGFKKVEASVASRQDAAGLSRDRIRQHS